MQALSMAAGHPEESGPRIFGDFAQACRSTYPASFTEVVDDGRRLFLWEFRIQ
jgi:hypothetical protein